MEIKIALTQMKLDWYILNYIDKQIKSLIYFFVDISNDATTLLKWEWNDV
jgi:hypothetical protein